MGYNGAMKQLWRKIRKSWGLYKKVCGVNCGFRFRGEPYEAIGVGTMGELQMAMEREMGELRSSQLHSGAAFRAQASPASGSHVCHQVTTWVAELPSSHGVLHALSDAASAKHLCPNFPRRSPPCCRTGNLFHHIPLSPRITESITSINSAPAVGRGQSPVGPERAQGGLPCRSSWVA